MRERTVLIEFQGHGSLFVEYNGKKYVFTPKQRVVEMPVGAYVHALTSEHLQAHLLIPAAPQGPFAGAEELEAAQRRVDELTLEVAGKERQIQLLENEVKKLKDAKKKGK